MVLPQPDAPSSTTNSPGRTRRSTPGRARSRRRVPRPKTLPTPGRSTAARRSGVDGPVEGGGHELPPGLSSPAASTAGLPAACSSVLSGPTSTNPARSVGVSVIPAVTLSWASCGNVAASGSGSRVMFCEGALDHRVGERVAGELLQPGLTIVLRLGRVARRPRRSPSGARAVARGRSPGTAGGTRYGRAPRWSGTARSATASRSSSSTLAPASSTSRELHGSGSQPPSTLPSRNASSVRGLSRLAILTSSGPSPAVSPLSGSHFFSAMSWVLPSCGVAIVRPLELLGAGDLGLHHELRAALGGAGDRAARPRPWTWRRR